MSPKKTIFHFDWTDPNGCPVSHRMYLADASMARHKAKLLQAEHNAGTIEVYRDGEDGMELVFTVVA